MAKTTKKPAAKTKAGAATTATTVRQPGVERRKNHPMRAEFDQFVMGVLDVLLAFPTLLLGLMIAAMLGASLENLIIAIAVTEIAPFARVARAPTITLRPRCVTLSRVPNGNVRWAAVMPIGAKRAPEAVFRPAKPGP